MNRFGWLVIGRPPDCIPGNGGFSDEDGRLPDAVEVGWAAAGGGGCCGGGVGAGGGVGGDAVGWLFVRFGDEHDDLHVRPGSGTGCTSGSGGSGPTGGGSSVAWLGAGGGGFFGGGAGAFAATLDTFIGSGGGGGSDYPDPASPPAGVSNVIVTDGVQSGNGLITVTYATLSDQLSALKAAVNAVAPKSSLSKLVKKINGYIAADDTANACSSLKGFIKQVKALAANKKINAAQAASLVDLAKKIETTLGC